MELYLRFKNFLQSRCFDGLFARFIIILIVDLILVQSIASRGFDNFLETFKYYYGNYPFESDFISSVKFSIQGGITRFLVPLILILLWLFKQKTLLKICFYIYLSLVNFKLIIAILFLVLGLWNPTASALNYLVGGCSSWVTNVLIFATWYWLVDREKQKQYLQDESAEINFLFSPTTSGLPRYKNWIPSFFDYLFLAFNTSISFSQSNAEYLTIKGRVLTMFQAAIALIINVIIIARSISIIGSNPPPQ